MKIVHCFAENKIEKETAQDIGFLLTNQLGGYLSLSDYPYSRYQGWFCAENEKVFKIIENLEIIDALPIEELTNNFWNIERKRNQVTESFFLPASSNSLVYELSSVSEIELILDIHESYDNRGWKREYEISEEDGIIIVRYNQADECQIYLAVKPDIFEYFKPDQWFARYYHLDEQRNSPPSKRYVYKALKLKGRKFVFSSSQNREKAVEEAKKVFTDAEELKKIKQRKIQKLAFPEIIMDPRIRMSFICARHSLDSLTVFQDPKKPGIYAGLPWFFQFWSEDEAISLKAVSGFNPVLAKKILFRLMESVKEDGKIPNISFGMQTKEDKESVYGIGWVFDRISDLAAKEKLNKNETQKIKKYLEKSVSGLLQNYTQDDLAINSSFDTWMDTQERSGARIENQALRLKMYQLAYQLTKESRYLKLERHLRKKVQEKFWNGEFLADGSDDFTVRPNIFIAAYLYPKLLKKEEWIKCFENVLSKLWLEWGGVATLDQTDPLFIAQYSGENGKSYHNGDSWFYLNNLIALVLYRFGMEKFGLYINKILEASEEEILWQGVIGHHGELSSAVKFNSEGSWAQAWSDAFYIEIIDELLKK